MKISKETYLFPILSGLRKKGSGSRLLWEGAAEKTPLFFVTSMFTVPSPLAQMWIEPFLLAPLGMPGS